MSICEDYYYWVEKGDLMTNLDYGKLMNAMRERHPMTWRDFRSVSESCCIDYRIQKEYEQSEAPMPWIGIYVAAASLVCSLAMAADVFHGFRHRKLWFPCKFFTLNAASLTLLGVAMKLPVDLSTIMPAHVDKLAKLTSTTFMCTTMGNFLPSLATMNDTEILMNMTALAILVITIFVNICIQLSTKVINYFFKEHHIITQSIMLVLLAISSFSALTVSTTKKHLQQNYDDMHKMISIKESEETEKLAIEKLKENVKKCWMMAESSSPQFVMARSVTCYASGAICFLAAVTLAEANIRLCNAWGWGNWGGGSGNPYFPNESRSSYKSSTSVILVIQSFGVVVGTIAPALRWFTAIRLRCSEKRVKSYKTELKTEYYWIDRLVEWRDRPLAVCVPGKKCRKLVHKTKNLILNFFIRVQVMIVMASKLILLLSIFFMSLLMSFGHYYKVLKQKLGCKPTVSNNHTEPDLGLGAKLDLSHYVLYLEGEEELPIYFLKNNRDATNHFIQKGKKQQPKYLKELLDRSTSFMGVAKFDSNQVPSLASEEPPNCWSLPVVTLTSIAIALPNNENHKVSWLLRSVREGLLYVNQVEKILDVKGDLANIRSAADIAWLGVDLFHKWLDEDLQKMALEGNNSRKTLEKLADIGKNNVIEFKANTSRDMKKNPLNWPIKAIAANSMYRISQTVLHDREGSNDQADETLFEQLSIMIADILGACLTNLPRVITMKCFSNAIEKREKSVLHAAQLLGETEEILKNLQQHELPSLNPDKVAYIEEWRALMRQQNSLAFTSSISDGTSSVSGELQIAIE